MPAYQSMLQPLSCQFGSRWSRRKAGPQTWAPMSPPVGVVRSNTRSASPVQRVEVDDVQHHVRRDEQRQAGHGDLDDAVGRPRALRPRRRPAHDPAADAPEPGRLARRRGTPTHSSCAARVRSSTARRRAGRRRPSRRRVARRATVAVAVVVGRPSSPSGSASVRSVIATGNDASRQPIASSRPGRVERRRASPSTCRGGRSRAGRRRRRGRRRTGRGTRRAGSG